MKNVELGQLLVKIGAIEIDDYITSDDDNFFYLKDSGVEKLIDFIRQDETSAALVFEESGKVRVDLPDEDIRLENDEHISVITRFYVGMLKNKDLFVKIVQAGELEILRLEEQKKKQDVQTGRAFCPLFGLPFRVLA